MARSSKHRLHNQYSCSPFILAILPFLTSPALILAQTPNCVIDANFETGTQGFSYIDSPNHSTYASGSLSNSGNGGDALELLLGGIDDTGYSDGNENAWEISFNGAGTITISGDLSLFITRAFEADEFGEARLRLDGQLYGVNGQNYLAHLKGSDTDQSSDHTTGWQSFTVSIPGQASGPHTLHLAGFNNKKTRSNETVQVLFDNIQICITPEGPDTETPFISITNPTNGAFYSTTHNALTLSGTASDNVGVANVSWENTANSTNGSAAGTDNWTVNGISLNPGLNELIVSAADAAGNVGSDTLNVTYTPDTTAPLISNVQVNNLTQNSAIITCSTDEVSDTQVEYGLNTSYGSTTQLDTSGTLSHVAQLSALTPDTIYHFRVLSRDASNNLAIGNDLTFQTLPVPPDSIPPSVNLTSPACNSLVTGLVNIAASASDNDVVAKVEFYINATLIATATSPPFETTWDTNSENDGVYNIIARAYDANNNFADDVCDVNVSNSAPVCVIDANFETGTQGFSYIDSPNHPEFATGSLASGNPGQGLELLLGNVNSSDYFDGNENGWEINFDGGGTVTISGEFNLIVDSSLESDEYGEARLRLDSQLYGLNGQSYLAHLDGDDNNQSSNHTTGWTPFSVSISGQPQGTHTLKLAGYNNKKTSSSETVEVFFDNIKICLTPDGPDVLAPTVNIESPTTASSYFTGDATISLSGTANDDRGVNTVSWFNAATAGSGSAVGTDNWSVNGIALTAGLNELTATASDAAGNTGQDILNVTYDPNLDTTPPVITNVTVDAVTSSSATITWTTDEPADSQVEYALGIINSGIVKIMPLGDSITKGKGSTFEHGFREDLDNLLSNAGYDFDLVGSLSTGSGFDTDHEGHAGFFTEGIDQSITSWILDSNPDIVLYHIGTNDITAGFSFSKIINDMTSTLDKIWAVNPNTWIIKSKIVPRKVNFLDDNTTTLNGLIESLVTSLQNDGRPISLVDHNSAFKANPNWGQDYMSDEKHPNDNGYNVMANVYFQGLQSILGNGTQSFTQTPLDPTLVVSHSVTFSGLSASTQYRYQVISIDGFGNKSISQDFTFITASDGSINADFSIGVQGFSYVDSQNHSNYADGDWRSSGGNSGGNLELVLGGVDDNSYSDGNENSWKISFSAGGNITITGDYNLFITGSFESNEFGEARLRFNGQLYGLNGQNYLAHLDGDDNQYSDTNTGWTSFSITIPNVPFGTHDLELAGFNNQKTRANESVRVNYDNVVVSSSQQTAALLKTVAETMDEPVIPLENQIIGNYPNPFNPTTKIMFSLAEDSEVQVKIYNILGQEVVTLLDDRQKRGIATIDWDGRNTYGRPVATGVYIMRVKTRDWSATHKLNLVK